MKKCIVLALCVFLNIMCVSSASAGPFGIEKGMSLADIKRMSKTAPVPIEDNKYYITPPKTNELFEKYIVQIDPDYGVYWLKAIGKNVHTNGYGDRLKSTFENLVASIQKNLWGRIISSRRITGRQYLGRS